MVPIRFIPLISIAVMSVAVGSVPAQAQQDPGRGTTVTDRPRPETDPLGLRMGSFLVFPSISVTEQFRDNIFFDEEGDSNTPNDLQGDFLTTLSPSLLIQSDWNNHELDIFGSADLGSFWINENENYADWQVGINGRYDISRNTNVAGRFDFANRHESRGSPDDANGQNPIFFNIWGPSVSAFHRFNRVSIGLSSNFIFYNFEDVTTGVNGSRGILTEGIINNDDRDRHEAEGSVRVAYEIVPGYEAFVRGTYNKRDYVDSIDDNNFDRDSTGWELVGGTAVDLTGVLVGNVFAGFRRQRYDDALLQTMQGPGFGGDLTWNPTGLTTVKAAIERSVEESTLAGAAGFFATRFAASVDHELLRNLIISAQSSVQLNDYEGNAREDEIYRAGAQVRYLMNRNFYVTVGYDFQNRQSSFINQNYTVNTVMIRLEGQL